MSDVAFFFQSFKYTGLQHLSPTADTQRPVMMQLRQRPLEQHFNGNSAGHTVAVSLRVWTQHYFYQADTNKSQQATVCQQVFHINLKNWFQSNVYSLFPLHASGQEKILQIWVWTENHSIMFEVFEKDQQKKPSVGKLGKVEQLLARKEASGWLYF